MDFPEISFNITTTSEQLSDVVSYYSSVDGFCFDVETWGENRVNPRINDVLWVALSTGDRTDVIPLGHPNGEYVRTDYPLLGSAQQRVDKGLTIRSSDYSRDERKANKVFTAPPKQLNAHEVFAALSKFFFDPNILKVGHNLKFDLQSVSKYFGGTPVGPYADTLVASFVLDTRNTGNLGLDDCLKRELNYDMVKGVGKEVEAYSFDEVAKYAALDAHFTWQLWENLEPRLAASKLSKVFALEMDVLAVLNDMELTGAAIDTEALAILKDEIEGELEQTKGLIYKAAGKAFNINSNVEKQNLLFTPKKNGGRGLKPKVVTAKGAPSVSADALEHHRGKDSLVDAFLAYADLNKMMTTYVLPYIGGDVTRTVMGKSKTTFKKSILINGRIHTDFVQYGAETGRFSSRNPNLQNIPAPRTKHGKSIRNLFIAPEGHSLIVADYSQIEPRIIASFSEDPVMLNNYLSGGDIYTTVGDIMGVNRQAGKVLVLSMAYGVGPDNIASQIGCSVKEASELLTNFLLKFKSVARYKKQVIAESRGGSREIPYVSTLIGRRRYLPNLRSSEFGLKAKAERQCFNTKIQGSAADIIKIAMVRAHSLIPEESKLILTVHDELVIITPDTIIDKTKNALQEAMEGINVLSVPLTADIKIVKRWGDAK